MKSFTKRHEELIDDLVRNLCMIRDTSKLLPHPVFIEEEGEDGMPEYFRYSLVDIHKDGGCSVIDPEDGIRTDNVYSLRQVSVDWLLTLWDWHIEQLIENGEWRKDAIRLLQEHTGASPDDIVDFCDSHWQNLLPYTENLEAFHKYIGQNEKGKY